MRKGLEPDRRPPKGEKTVLTRANTLSEICDPFSAGPPTVREPEGERVITPTLRLDLRLDLPLTSEATGGY
jgi:hypothetical protein